MQKWESETELILWSYHNSEHHKTHPVEKIQKPINPNKFSLDSRVLLEDGTVFQETAYLKPNAKGDDYVLVKEGTYGHNTPEGKFVQISYVADELGYRPVGDAIPKSASSTF